MTYQPSADRYEGIKYRYSGRSGLKLPELSLGLWHNFGHNALPERARQMCRTAFDHGITHFDLANNYGPPPGSAEEHFGDILATDFRGYRDELVISTKAGYLMWPGPYGEWGSRKYLLSSLDQSLKRMRLDYVDIFYSHRVDPNTPLEETMGALDFAVRSGRALYAGISNYSPEKTAEAARILRDLGTPCLIHQPSYSMFNRWIEDGLLDVLDQRGAQHLGEGPEFADRKLPHRLIGLNIGQDVFLIQAQVNVRGQFPRQAVDARQTAVGLARERRELPVIPPGQIQPHVTGVAFKDVFIVEEPLGGRRHALLQMGRVG